LVVVSETQTGREIPVAGEKYLIGRGDDCQLRPQSNLVSRKHCAILVEKGAVAIEDFGSTNGTFVNEEKVAGRRELKNGDQIRVGALVLEVRLSVGIGGPKKPKVTSVGEVVRTVAKTAAAGDELDISNWLGDEPDDPAAFSSQSTLAIGGDTFIGKSLTDTTAIPKLPQPHLKEAKKEKHKEAPAKAAAKPKPIRPKTDSSGQAAEDALRQFFHRRK